MQEYTQSAIARIDISGADIATLGGFYRGLFDRKVEEQGPRFLHVEKHKGSEKGAAVESRTTFITIGLAVENLEQTVDIAKACGGKIVTPATDIGWGEKARIADPRSNAVCVIELQWEFGTARPFELGP
ncbi:MAG: VOC family protein [Pseudomonadota bacterium]